MIKSFYQHLVIPGFETVIKRRRTMKYRKELGESQWWSRERLQELQLRRLRRLLEYSAAHSAYYREVWVERGLDVGQLQSLGDFQNWPVTRRSDVIEHEKLIRTTIPGMKVISKSTGGSSGVPLRFALDCEADDRRTAAADRGYGWAGAAPGTRQTYLWGVALGRPSRYRQWKDFIYARYLYRRDILNSFEMSEETIPRYLTRLHRFRPETLIAYTNPLYQFARVIEAQGLQPYQPNAIIVGAERIHDFQRELIERVFNAPVFETYGSREFTLIGAECEQHCGLHLTMENLVVEIVDDNGAHVAPGEEGNVVITDLFNVAMPFVRYAIGDRAVAGFKSCDCGRGLPLLIEVLGRELDVLVTIDGRRLPGEFFPHLLKDYAAVRQFQVVQHRRDHVDVNLVVDDSWGLDEREMLLQEAQGALGARTHVEIHEVDEIPLTHAGKSRVVISCDSLLGKQRLRAR